MNKKYLLYAIVPVIALASIGGFVLADSIDANKANPMANIVNAITERFNLNASDVQAVFDEQKATMDANREQRRKEMQADMQAKFEEKIDQGVIDGKLTQAQADLVFAKKAELQSQNINMEGKTKEEIMLAQKNQRDSLKQWAKDNNIPTEYLIFCGMGGHGAPGGFGFQINRGQGIENRGTNSASQ